VDAADRSQALKKSANHHVAAILGTYIPKGKNDFRALMTAVSGGDS
jgi:hypothetical protein